MCQGLGPKKHDEISEIDSQFEGVGFPGQGGASQRLRLGDSYFADAQPAD